MILFKWLNLTGCHGNIKGTFSETVMRRMKLLHVYNIILCLNRVYYSLHPSVCVDMETKSLLVFYYGQSGNSYCKHFDKIFAEMFLELSSNNHMNVIISLIGCHCNIKDSFSTIFRLAFNTAHGPLVWSDQFEPRHEKTNILVSDLAQHKPGCTAAEDDYWLEISDLESRWIVQSM